MYYNKLLRPLLFRSDPELTHNVVHFGAKFLNNSDGFCDLVSKFNHHSDANLHQTISGITFKNPVGLAAGFDKNGHLPHIMGAFGFGFTEIGSITALASSGNKKPRLFRLPNDKALINRMGLNNDGARVIVDRLAKMRAFPIPVGINIAKTHNPEILGKLAIRDYVTSFVEAKRVADYITINISCPNTEEGKTFENPEALSALLQAIQAQRVTSIPVFVKFSADLEDDALAELLNICEGFGIDGYVATNTSAGRDNLTLSSKSKIAKCGRGGLSGSPLFDKSLRIVGEIAKRTGFKKPIIGVGGIQSADDAIEMLKSGAWLVQLYTGLIYEGPGLVTSINRKVSEYLNQNVLRSVREMHQIK